MPNREVAHFFSRRKQKPGHQTLVKMENVSVIYDGNRILSSIDWVIHRGDRWALLGPNGSGKSTLLSLVFGDNPQAYANTIYIFGKRRGSGESVWNLKRRIGWISPELHLHFPEDQTCLETVISGFHESTGFFKKHTRKQQNEANRILRYFGMSRFGSIPFGSISTGLQRMILLSRALVKSPDILLLDEPCHGLDAMHRNMFIKVVESLIRLTPITIVYVTHVSDEIPQGIHQVIQLQDGRILRIQREFSRLNRQSI